MNQADPPVGVLSGDMFDQVRPQMEAIELPAGYVMSFEGEYGDSSEANEGLAATMPFGFGAMIVVVFLLSPYIRDHIFTDLKADLAQQTQQVANQLREDYLRLRRNQSSY